MITLEEDREISTSYEVVGLQVSFSFRFKSSFLVAIMMLCSQKNLGEGDRVALGFYNAKKEAKHNQSQKRKHSNTGI